MNVLDYVGAIGATFVFTWGSLFTKVRAWYPKFFECPLCVGFWVGLATALYRYRLTADPLDYFFAATTVATLSLVVSTGVERLQLALVEFNKKS